MRRSARKNSGRGFEARDRGESFFKKGRAARLKDGIFKREAVPRQEDIKALIENAAIASSERIPICQDTGMATVFLEVGQNVLITGGDLSKTINSGIAGGYKKRIP